MKFLNHLLKISFLAILLFSCEEAETKIEPISRVETTEETNDIIDLEEPEEETDFLQIDQKFELLDILATNSIDNYWEITKLQKGPENFEDRFKGIRLVFMLEESTDVSANTYEKGNTNQLLPDGFITTSPILNNDANNDLLMPFLTTIGSDLSPRVVDKEKYTILESIGKTNGETLFFSVLKEINNNKVTLFRTIEGVDHLITLEKKTIDTNNCEAIDFSIGGEVGLDIFLIASELSGETYNYEVTQVKTGTTTPIITKDASNGDPDHLVVVSSGAYQFCLKTSSADCPELEVCKILIITDKNIDDSIEFPSSIPVIFKDEQERVYKLKFVDENENEVGI